MTTERTEAERLADRLLEEISLGIQVQFDETRTQHEDVIQEYSLQTSIEEQLRHSGLLDKIVSLQQERDAATREAESLRKSRDAWKEQVALLREEVGQLRAEREVAVKIIAAEMRTKTAQPSADDELEIRHPLTGDTVIVSKKTGRVLKIRPSADDVERARKIAQRHIAYDAGHGADKRNALAGDIADALAAARAQGSESDQ